MNIKNKASFVNFPIGNACNLRCNFCYNDSWRENKQYFEDINILKERLNNYKFKGQKLINIIGGEPLIYPKIFELLDFLKENNFIITIVTNGIKLSDKKFMDDFLKYRNTIRNINLSIHSHNKILEDQITNRKGTFDKKISGIIGLKENNFHFSLSLVINNLNIDYLYDIIYFYVNKFNISISLQGMLTYKDFSDLNIKSIPSYTKNIRKITEIIKKGIKIQMIHWFPLCIHFKIKNINYRIRELDRIYVYSFKRDGTNLLNSHLDKNYIGYKCRKCYAFGKFCFGPGKIYVNKYGYDEFKSLRKNDVVKLIKLSNKNINNEIYKKI